VRVGNEWKDELVKVRKWVHTRGLMAENSAQEI
jgi:hypothetical protein